MDSQFPLFERPDKKGINQPPQHVKPYRECEELEATYKEHLHHCRRLKQTNLPNEIIQSFQQQISSGMDNEIILGLLYCILTTNNPNCIIPWDNLQELRITDKSIITNALYSLVDDYIMYLTSDALDQIFWFLDSVLRVKYYAANTNKFITHAIICVMRHIDVNRVTRYSLTLSLSVRKFVFNHLDWMVELNKNSTERIFIHQIIYLFLRLIENHDHNDLRQSRADEVRFVSRLFDKFPDSWIGIGRDFLRVFQHLYPIDGLTQYWGLIDNISSSKLIQILSNETHPSILQVCIGKQEQNDLVQLSENIQRQKDRSQIVRTIESFVEKYLKRNKFAEHSCDVIRFIISCYNTATVTDNNKDPDKIPYFANKDIFMFNILFYFFCCTWNNDVRTFIYEAIMEEVLYAKPTPKEKKNKMPTCKITGIIDRVLQQGSTRAPEITANFMILILETVRHYKSYLTVDSSMQRLCSESVTHFFRTSPNQCHNIMDRADFSSKFGNLIKAFKSEFAELYSLNTVNIASNSIKNENKLNNISVSKQNDLKLNNNNNNNNHSRSKPASKVSLTMCDQMNTTQTIISSQSLQKVELNNNRLNDINNIKKILISVQSTSPFNLSLFSTKLEELRKPLIDYYRIKYIDIQHYNNSDKQARIYNNKVNDLVKVCEKYLNQILRAYEEYLLQLMNSNSNKKNEFIKKFAKLLIDIFSMDYYQSFINPSTYFSSLWQCLLDWISKITSEKLKNIKLLLKSNAHNNRKELTSFEFDFNENRIWLIKEMCCFQKDIIYIVLLYDSRCNDSNGFIKHLGVNHSHCNTLVSSRLRNMNSWNNKSISGIKINAHQHELIYGRRPFESIICDLCDTDWNGSSWHCSTGCDFDTCHNCFKSFLRRKQLYRSIIYLRANYDNLKLKISSNSNITISSEIFYDDIKYLSHRSSLLLSCIHQYLFYSYSSYIHTRIMDLLQIILRVINPQQIQSLCKDIQLALFKLFNQNDINNNLYKKIEISLKFPSNLQSSFWLLLSSTLRTHTNSDELYWKTLKYFHILKKKSIKNNNYVWITPQSMNGILNWTQYVYKSKKIEDIYETLLSFPIKACGNKDKDTQSSTSTSTTVFSQSSSSFDEFHIQALVHLLSLKSPKWKLWLQFKLKSLKIKYEQKQIMYDNDNNISDKYSSLKKRKRNVNDNDVFLFTVNIDKKDEYFLTNLLKFYQYLTYIEPNINQSTVSMMANTFLFDADQRNLLVKFFKSFSKLNTYLTELKDFWPPESSKASNSLSLSLSPKKLVNINNNDMQNLLLNGSSSNSNSNSNNNDVPNIMPTFGNLVGKKRKLKYNNNDVVSDDDDYSMYNEMSDDDDDMDFNMKKHKKNNKKLKKRPNVSAVSHNMTTYARDRDRNSISNSNSNSSSNSKKHNKYESDSSSSSKSSKNKNKIIKNKNKNKNKIKNKNKKYNKLNRKFNDLNTIIPSSPKSLTKNISLPFLNKYNNNNSNNSNDIEKSNSPMLIPKKKNSSHVTAFASMNNNKKRTRTQFNNNNNNNNNNSAVSSNTSNTPPSKKRKISSNNNDNNNNNMTQITQIRRTRSENNYNKNRNKKNNDDIIKRTKLSPKRRKRVINDSDDDDDDDDDNNTHIVSVPKKKQNMNVVKSPTRSESSVGSYEYDDDEEYDDVDEDSLANKYTQESKRSSPNTNDNDHPNIVESWGV